MYLEQIKCFFLEMYDDKLIKRYKVCPNSHNIPTQQGKIQWKYNQMFMLVGLFLMCRLEIVKNL